MSAEKNDYHDKSPSEEDLEYLIDKKIGYSFSQNDFQTAANQWVKHNQENPNFWKEKWKKMVKAYPLLSYSYFSSTATDASRKRTEGMVFFWWFLEQKMQIAKQPMPPMRPNIFSACMNDFAILRKENIKSDDREARTMPNYSRLPSGHYFKDILNAVQNHLGEACNQFFLDGAALGYLIFRNAFLTEFVKNIFSGKREPTERQQ